jgi:hypothetical protein
MPPGLIEKRLCKILLQILKASLRLLTQRTVGAADGSIRVTLHITTAKLIPGFYSIDIITDEDNYDEDNYENEEN